jgi:excisionase family DNA binding protein
MTRWRFEPGPFRPICPLRSLRCTIRMGQPSDLIGTSEAAELLGVSPGRIRQLVQSGQLPAERVGRTLVIRRRDLDLFASQPPGRPRHARRVR